jgi:hypothetical protein
MTTYQGASPKIRVWPRNELEPKLTLDNACIAFECSNKIQDPEGSFSLTLLPYQGDYSERRAPGIATRVPDLYRLIRPGDVVSIGFDVPGGIMVGIVSSVKRVKTYRGKQPMFGVTVQGSNYGKLLNQDNIIHASVTAASAPDFIEKLKLVIPDDHILLESIPGLWGPKAPGLEDVPGVFVGQPVTDVVEWILKVGASMTLSQLRHLYGGEVTPGEIITVDHINVWHDGRIWNEGLNDYQGNLWSFIKSLVDADLYELFLWSKPKKNDDLPEVFLTLRPKPYDDPDLDFAEVDFADIGISRESMRTLVEGESQHVIDLAEVYEENIGVSDADTFAYYEVSAQHDLIGNDQSRAEGLYYPLVDTFQLQRYGLRAYRGRLTLMAPDLAEKVLGERADESELHIQVKDTRNRLFNWYRLADYFETGGVTVAGRDVYRAGDPVFFPHMQPQIGEETGVKFYCIGTTHKWSYGGNYECALQLTRGYNKGVITAAKGDIELDAPSGNSSHFAEV